MILHYDCYKVSFALFDITDLPHVEQQSQYNVIITR